jgi:hypothetical protein
MTTMRSVEPMTGLDALLARLLPFLNGAEPRPGERGVDQHMRVFVWTPAPGGWVPDLPWWGALPGLAAKAEAHWQAQAEPEAG